MFSITDWNELFKWDLCIHKLFLRRFFVYDQNDLTVTLHPFTESL